MADNTSIFKIQYIVEGKDLFKPILKQNIKDLDKLIEKFDKLSRKRLTKGGQPARTYGNVKVTQDLKVASQTVVKFLSNIKERVGDVKKINQALKQANLVLKNTGNDIKILENEIEYKIASNKNNEFKLQIEYYKEIQNSLIRLRNKILNSVKRSVYSKNINTNEINKILKDTNNKINKILLDSFRKQISMIEKEGRYTEYAGRSEKEQTSARLIGVGRSARSEATKTAQRYINVDKFRLSARKSLDRISLEIKKFSEQYSNINKITLNAYKKQFIDIYKKWYKILKDAKGKGQLTDKLINNAFRQINNTTKDVNNKIRQTASEARKQLSNEEKVNRLKFKYHNILRDRLSKLIHIVEADKMSANVFKRINAKNLQKHVDNLFNTITKAIDNISDTIDPKEAQKHLSGIMEMFKEGSIQFEKLRRSGTFGSLGEIFNKANVQAFAGVMGSLGLRFGGLLERGLKATHTQGRVAGAFSDMMTSVFMTTSYDIFREVSNIMGQIVDIIVETLMETYRLLTSVIIGIIKGLGLVVVKGVLSVLATTFPIFTGTITTLLTGLSGVVVIGIFTLVQTIMSIITELSDFLKNILTSLMSIITSIIKLALMTIVNMVKAIGKTIFTIVKGALTSIKQLIISFVDAIKRLMRVMVNIVKEGFNEFVDTMHYATRAFKETVGVHGQTVDKFVKLMNRVRAAFGFRKEDVGEAMFDIVSSGFRNISDTMKIMDVSAQLAIRSQSRLATATNALITAFQNFDTKGETVASIARTISASVTLGRMTMEDLGTAMRNVMGLASRAGLKFKDTMAALSMMTRVFGRGSIEQGTRYFNRFIEAITMPRSKARKELEALGISLENVGKSGNLLGGIVAIINKMKNLDFSNVRKVFTTIQSRRAWLALTNDVDKFMKMWKNFDTVSKNVQWQFKLMIKEPQRILYRLSQTVQILMQKVGKVVWGIFGKYIILVMKQLYKLVRFLDSEKGEKFFKGLIKWLKPIVDTLLKPLTIGFKNLINIITKGNFDKIFNTENVKELQKTIINIINKVYNFVGVVFNSIKNSKILNNTLKTIYNIVVFIIEYIKNADLISALENIINKVKLLKEIIKEIMIGKNKNIHKTFQNTIITIIAIIKNAIITIGKMIWDILVPIFGRFMILIGERLKMTFLDAGQALIDLLANALSNIPIIGNMLKNAQINQLTGQYIQTYKYSSGITGEKNVLGLNKISSKILSLFAGLKGVGKSELTKFMSKRMYELGTFNPKLFGGKEYAKLVLQQSGILRGKNGINKETLSDIARIYGDELIKVFKSVGLSKYTNLIEKMKTGELSVKESVNLDRLLSWINSLSNKQNQRIIFGEKIPTNVLNLINTVRNFIKEYKIQLNITERLTNNSKALADGFKRATDELGKFIDKLKEKYTPKVKENVNIMTKEVNKNINKTVFERFITKPKHYISDKRFIKNYTYVSDYEKEMIHKTNKLLISPNFTNKEKYEILGKKLNDIVKEINKFNFSKKQEVSSMRWYDKYQNYIDKMIVRGRKEGLSVNEIINKATIQDFIKNYLGISPGKNLNKYIDIKKKIEYAIMRRIFNIVEDMQNVFYKVIFSNKLKNENEQNKNENKQIIFNKVKQKSPEQKQLEVVNKQLEVQKKIKENGEKMNDLLMQLLKDNKEKTNKTMYIFNNSTTVSEVA